MTFLLNPVICMLHNAETDRFHPILFQESPLPGEPTIDKPVRHKSKGHHTQGCDTREEAMKTIEQIQGNLELKAKLILENDIEWDGKGIPAMVVFFPEMQGKS